MRHHYLPKAKRKLKAELSLRRKEGRRLQASVVAVESAEIKKLACLNSPSAEPLRAKQRSGIHHRKFTTTGSHSRSPKSSASNGRQKSPAERDVRKNEGQRECICQLRQALRVSHNNGEGWCGQSVTLKCNSARGRRCRVRGVNCWKLASPVFTRSCHTS